MSNSIAKSSEPSTCKSRWLACRTGDDLQGYPFSSRTLDAGRADGGCGCGPLRAVGYEVTTGVGKTGVVGLLRNGEGPTVMLRADMDALPVQEATGLPYASKVTATDSAGKSVPVMHACGHDMHVTWLIGTAKLFAKSRDAWKGTLMPVFQPAEETAQGAQAMIDDGLFKRFPKPDVMLGQHVMCMPAGVIAGRIGVTTSAADSLQIKLFGRGAHGSMPEASIDPVVMAAATVLRLQEHRFP